MIQSCQEGNDVFLLGVLITSMKETFIRSLDNIKDTDNLTFILQIFGLQEQPNFSKSQINFRSNVLTREIQRGWRLKGDF